VYSHLVVSVDLDVRVWTVDEERQRRLTQGTGTISILASDMREEK